jgi:AcrR family transcriptional regulator
MPSMSGSRSHRSTGGQSRPDDVSEFTKGEQTRRAILDAAITRFGRDGYRATSVADIARDANVGGTVAYAYFPNKEALFLAAIDEDAASVIGLGLLTLVSPDHSVKEDPDWRQTLFFTLVESVDRHPLAQRLLAGLEPEVTDRVLEIPALSELRKACAERLRREQLTGAIRPDIDPEVIGNGVVTIILSLLMSVVQLGASTAVAYAHDVSAVFAAALEADPTPDTPV